MRRMLFAAIALLALFTPTTQAAEPTVFVRLQSVKELLGKAKYFAKLADQEEIASQFLGIVEAMDGPKGIEGVDTGRPIGFTTTLETAGPLNPILLMIPVADEKDFVGLLAKFTAAPKKDKDGIYPVELPGVPVPVFMKVAQKYAFVTIQDREYLADDKLPDAAKLLAGAPESVASMHFRFDRLPKDIRDLVIGQVENQAAAAKEKKQDGESEAVRKFRLQATDYSVESLKMLLTEGKELALDFTIDPKADDIQMAAKLTATPGTELAKALTAATKSESAILGALPAADAVARFGLNVGLPSSLRKNLDTLVDDGIQKVVDDITDANAAPLAEKLLKALAPTLKSGVLDGGVALYGPDADKKYTLVLAGKVVKGGEVEKTVKSIVGDLPPQIQDAFAFDVEKKDGVTLHEVKIGDHLDAKGQEMFGPSSLWLGTSEGRLLVGIGPGAKSHIQRIAAAGPKSASVMTGEVSVASIVPLTDPANADKMRAAMKKVFGGDPKGADRVTLTMEGGEGVTLTLKAKGKLVTLGAATQKALSNE